MIFDLSLAFFTISAVLLNNSENKIERKIAPILGLAAQPLWFYKAFVGHDLGIFIVTVCLSASWLRGYYNQWMKI